jgi:hypothetical protein
MHDDARRPVAVRQCGGEHAFFRAKLLFQEMVDMVGPPCRVRARRT